MTRLAVALLLASLLAGCGGNEPGPTPGDLRLSLTTSQNSDGGVLVLVSGGPVLTVTGAPGITVSGAPSGMAYRILATGALPNGDFATIRVPDVSKAALYTAQIEQVADRSTYVLRDPAGYQVQVRR